MLFFWNSFRWCHRTRVFQPTFVPFQPDLWLSRGMIKSDTDNAEVTRDAATTATTEIPLSLRCGDRVRWSDVASSDDGGAEDYPLHQDRRNVHEMCSVWNPMSWDGRCEATLQAKILQAIGPFRLHQELPANSEVANETRTLRPSRRQQQNDKFLDLRHQLDRIVTSDRFGAVNSRSKKRAKAQKASKSSDMATTFTSTSLGQSELDPTAKEEPKSVMLEELQGPVFFLFRLVCFFWRNRCFFGGGFRWFHKKTLPTNRDLLPFISFYDIFFVVVCLEPLFSVTPHA